MIYNYDDAGSAKTWNVDQFFGKDFFAKDLCGWTVVRSLPKDSLTWYPFEFLDGSEVSGDPLDNTIAWGIKYDNLTFDTFLFTTGDYQTEWMVVESS